MRLLPSDPDIETLVGRIEKGDLDLQPDFQRGEIWSLSKRQRLIDSVLRDWHVPPIHVIQNDDQTVAVLDGQQRLAAIRDFVRGDFRVDGGLPPFDEGIARLGGLKFAQLPGDLQRRFLRFPIRLFTIVDYRPAEPGELFYRLNQLSSLTSAEQRNAFFGETRKQVKHLVDLVEDFGIGGSVLGFSNARMAYDDVIARSLYLIEAGTLRRKVTSAALADLYRTDGRFSEGSIRRVSGALATMGLARRVAVDAIRLNKATAQTWIVFLAVAPDSLGYGVDQHILSEFMARFEVLRGSFVNDMYDSELAATWTHGNDKLERGLWLRRALFEYEDRATSRVADISSVVLRDLVLWIFLLSGELGPAVVPSDERKSRLLDALTSGRFRNVTLEELAEELSWGAQL